MFSPLPNRREIARQMEAAATHLGLPFRRRTWRGHAGNWSGAGVGSSIDFQDHRPYMAGDDPRHIDWRAYARTGSYTMKLYREEVSPFVDLLLDASRSMFLGEEKARRTWEIFCFCETSARQAGASLHCFVASGSQVRPLDSSEAFQEGDLPEKGAAPGLDCNRVPWRRGSLRVLVSDLLFPGAPDAVLSTLSMGDGHGVVFAPFCAAGSAPGWKGNLELEDCESGRKRLQLVDEALLGRYERAYAQHFGLWRERARKRAVLLARVPAARSFREALQAEALPLGAVELR